MPIFRCILFIIEEPMTLGYSILLSSSPHSIALYLANQISWNRNKAQQTFSSAILDCDTIRVIEKFQIVNTCFSYSAVVNCFVLQSKHITFQKANDIGLAMANIKIYYVRNQTTVNFFRLSIFFQTCHQSNSVSISKMHKKLFCRHL